jgi:glycosyltransferase involved in cell wall biosynthesis
MAEAAQRVLMTTDTVGGVWTYSLELCQGLARHGVRVALATMGAPLTAEQCASVEQLENVQVFESAYRLEWMSDSWDEVDRAGEWLCDLASALRPDIIHLGSYSHGALRWPAPVVLVAHSCVLSWWRAVKGEDAPAEWHTYQRRVEAGLAGVDLVVAPTRAMLDAILLHYRPGGATRVIANGRDPHRFTPAVKEPLVFAAGRLWDEAKNLAALDACSADLPWPVYVAGATRHPEGHEIRTASARLGMHLLGPLPQAQVARWLARASIYALPARYEPFGLSVLEAALSGCALVLGDIPSLREVWGDAAVYVDPGDSGELGRALHRLIQAPAARATLAARARVRAHRFTARRMARAYLDAYDTLAGQGREPGPEPWSEATPPGHGAAPGPGHGEGSLS